MSYHSHLGCRNLVAGHGMYRGVWRGQRAVWNLNSYLRGHVLVFVVGGVGGVGGLRRSHSASVSWGQRGSGRIQRLKRSVLRQ